MVRFGTYVGTSDERSLASRTFVHFPVYGFDNPHND